MSDYPRGDWCEIWDGLYWSFIDDHREIFRRNPRTSMMVRLLEKMDPKRFNRLRGLSDSFRASVCEEPIKK